MQSIRRSERSREPPGRHRRHGPTGRTAFERTVASVGVLATTLVVVLAAVTLGVGVSAATGGTTTAGIDTCQEIDSPGTYTLTKDIDDYDSQGNPPKDSCFFITADGVTLDGRGHTITLHDTAVFVKGDDVTVTNVVIEPKSGKPTTGIEYSQANGGKISNAEIRNLQTGIVIEDWGNHAITNNVIEGMTGHGIHLRGQTEDNLISNNEVRDNQEHGILLRTGAVENEISGNHLVENEQAAIQIRTDDNVVTGNTIENNYLQGMVLETASGTEISDNRVRDNGRSGIVLDVSDDNEIRNNTVTENDVSGIMVEKSDRNLVEKNDVNANDDGIELDDSLKNEIRGNSVTGNGKNGTYVHSGSDGNGFFHNNFNDNDDHGIAIHGSDGNKFVNNSALDNYHAAFYTAGSGKTDAWDLRIGLGNEPIAIGFRGAERVQFDPGSKQSDGPNPNDLPGGDPGDVFVETPRTATVTASDSDQVLRELADHMNVSDKATIHTYVRVRPTGEAATRDGVDANLETLRIYYDNDDLNCNVESDLELWRFSPGSSSGPEGVWRSDYAAQDRGTTGTSVNLQEFGSISMDSSKYVEASNLPNTNEDVVSFPYDDNHVFAAMSDVQSGCTPETYEEDSPGFGLAAAVIALLVLFSRRLMAGRDG